jgi:hypothetical protein
MDILVLKQNMLIFVLSHVRKTVLTVVFTNKLKVLKDIGPSVYELE